MRFRGRIPLLHAMSILASTTLSLPAATSCCLSLSLFLPMLFVKRRLVERERSCEKKYPSQITAVISPQYPRSRHTHTHSHSPHVNSDSSIKTNSLASILVGDTKRHNSFCSWWPRSTLLPPLGIIVTLIEFVVATVINFVCVLRRAIVYSWENHCESVFTLTVFMDTHHLCE